MKFTRQLIVALFGTTIGFGVLAQEATPDTWMKTAATKSRDAVQQELLLAKGDGSIPSEAYKFVERTSGSREQVRSELIASKHSGEYKSLQAEAHAFDAPRSQGGTMAMVGR
jgi:hypothetical protein